MDANALHKGNTEGVLGIEVTPSLAEEVSL
jgi:hypothetical protein